MVVPNVWRWQHKNKYRRNELKLELGYQMLYIQVQSTVLDIYTTSGTVILFLTAIVN